MGKFELNKTNYTQSKLLEYLAGATQYRTVSSVVKIFGNGIWFDIPSAWYDRKGEKIRLSLAGWNELVSRGGRVTHPRYCTPAIRSGRAVFNVPKREYYWVKPSYLESKAGVK